MIHTTRRSSKELVRRLLTEYILRYRSQLAMAIICMALVGLCTAGNAYMLKPALDDIFFRQDADKLLIIPLIVLGISVVSAASNYGNVVFMRYVGQRIIADMQIELFSHLMKSDVALFTSQSSGRLISRFTNDIQMMRNAVSSTLTGMVKELITMVALMVVMFTQNAQLAAICIVAFPAALYPIFRLGKKMRRVASRTQEELGEFTAQLDDVFQGVRTVKAYTGEAFEAQRARNSIERLFKQFLKSTRLQASTAPLLEIVSGSVIAFVIWYGGSQVVHGVVTPGAFFSFVAAFIMAYRPVKALTNLNSVFQEGLAAASRLFDMLDTEPTVQDRAGAGTLALQGGEIRFENVVFHYPEGGGVDGVSFTVPSGKTAALVGLSGSGKSTLMQLLLRFYDVESGRITIDGQDIRDITLQSLRQHMAFVPQETMLFDDSVGANIAYGRHDASMEDIKAAARAAAANEFIEAMPEGYEAMIGSHGVKLSGGQRQRIAIARAMLKNAPILLLDEATSALDNQSERAVQQALQNLMKGRTSLIIAHRLSTIAHADIIYVMEAGKLVESGSHAELLAKGGVYATLYATHAASGVL